MQLLFLAGPDSADATSAGEAPSDFAAALRPRGDFSSAPLQGRRFGLIRETHGEGVDAPVREAVEACAKHLESLGAIVEEVGAFR